MNGTIKDVIVELRDEGHAIGAASIVSFRPFPSDELHGLLSHAKRLVVIEKSLAVGIGGIVSHNLRMALFGISLHAYTVVGRVGGRAITNRSSTPSAQYAPVGPEGNTSWVRAPVYGTDSIATIVAPDSLAPRGICASARPSRSGWPAEPPPPDRRPASSGHGVTANDRRRPHILHPPREPLTLGIESPDRIATASSATARSPVGVAMRAVSGRQIGQPYLRRLAASSALSQLQPGGGSSARATGGPQSCMHSWLGPGRGVLHFASLLVSTGSAGGEVGTGEQAIGTSNNDT